MANKLATAIDNLSSDLNGKLQAINDAINSVNVTLDTKLALIQGAIGAQTLELSEKTRVDTESYQVTNP